MTDTLHIVLDDAAMVAAGHDNILASRLIHRAHAEPGWFLYAPACALVEAERARPGTAEHIAALPGITVLELWTCPPPSQLRARPPGRSHTPGTRPTRPLTAWPALWSPLQPRTSRSASLDVNP